MLLLFCAGVIVGVDEDKAFSWPICSHCHGDQLAESTDNPRYMYVNFPIIQISPSSIATISIQSYIQSSWNKIQCVCALCKISIIAV